jgi:hypothetical protein
MSRRTVKPGFTWDKDVWIVEALTKGPYRVEDNGTVIKRLKGGDVHIVKPSVHKRSGRVVFTMTYDGLTKTVLLNRVVALALLPNPDNFAEVNHKDGNKQNNHPDNLEWANRSAQERHAFRSGLKANRGTANANAKLNPLVVQGIRESKKTDQELARLCNVSVSTIRNARLGRTWTHLP